jgi:hypothetical protein
MFLTVEAEGYVSPHKPATPSVGKPKLDIKSYLLPILVRYKAPKI